MHARKKDGLETGAGISSIRGIYFPVQPPLQGLLHWLSNPVLVGEWISADVMFLNKTFLFQMPLRLWTNKTFVLNIQSKSTRFFYNNN